jgi:hypothetical protein
MLKFVINHVDDVLVFWSNEIGWTNYDEATFFTEKERNEFTPPIGGRWCTDVTEILAMQ